MTLSCTSSGVPAELSNAEVSLTTTQANNLLSCTQSVVLPELSMRRSNRPHEQNIAQFDSCLNQTKSQSVASSRLYLQQTSQSSALVRIHQALIAAIDMSKRDPLGALNGTVLLHDINSGARDSYPGGLTIAGNKL